MQPEKLEVLSQLKKNKNVNKNLSKGNFYFSNPETRMLKTQKNKTKKTQKPKQTKQTNNPPHHTNQNKTKY